MKVLISDSSLNPKILILPGAITLYRKGKSQRLFNPLRLQSEETMIPISLGKCFR